MAPNNRASEYTKQSYPSCAIPTPGRGLADGLEQLIWIQWVWDKCLHALSQLLCRERKARKNIILKRELQEPKPKVWSTDHRKEGFRGEYSPGVSELGIQSTELQLETGKQQQESRGRERDFLLQLNKWHIQIACYVKSMDPFKGPTIP